MSEVPLKEHFERILAEHDRRITQAQESAERAVDKAATAVDKRLDLLNEFRAQSADESSNYVRLDQWANLTERVKVLESLRDRVYGGIAIALLVVAGLFGLIKLFWGK